MCLYLKRLEKARFCSPRIGHHRVQLNAAQLMALVDGRLHLQRGQEGRTGHCRRNHFADARSGLRIDEDGLFVGLCQG
ncbi:hypothetical protein XH92_36100 [Bradyrhizobium sp. CCBAU 53421]|nr:hypothetical protein XH92_36100 [Bradyrhizobium sp. CCBAU 53421]